MNVLRQVYKKYFPLFEIEEKFSIAVINKQEAPHAIAYF